MIYAFGLTLFNACYTGFHLIPWQADGHGGRYECFIVACAVGVLA